MSQSIPVLQDLNSRGLKLSIINGRLDVRPKELLTKGDLVLLQEHKQQLIWEVQIREDLKRNQARWQPAYLCSHCGAPLTLTLETATTIETILAEGVESDEMGRVVCGKCLHPQPDDQPEGQRASMG